MVRDVTGQVTVTCGGTLTSGDQIALVTGIYSGWGGTFAVWNVIITRICVAVAAPATFRRVGTTVGGRTPAIRFAEVFSGASQRHCYLTSNAGMLLPTCLLTLDDFRTSVPRRR